MKIIKNYFSEFGFNISDQSFVKMNHDVKTYHMKIIMLYENLKPVGFALFQVDKKENPWGMKEGAGDIREFDIEPSFRRKGYGRVLFQAIKTWFQGQNVSEILLTCDDQQDFWLNLGFKDLGYKIEENNSQVFGYDLKKTTRS